MSNAPVIVLTPQIRALHTKHTHAVVSAVASYRPFCITEAKRECFTRQLPHLLTITSNGVTIRTGFESFGMATRAQRRAIGQGATFTSVDVMDGGTL